MRIFSQRKPIAFSLSCLSFCFTSRWLAVLCALLINPELQYSPLHVTKGHCKSMAPDWNKVGDEYAGSSVLIGDVDCTADGEPLCESHEIRGYPTLKVFKDGDTAGEDYSGGRDFESLKNFVEENLEAMCDINELKDCSDKEKGYIEKMKSKTDEDRAAQLKRLNGMKGGSMKADLKLWLNQRLRILKQMEASDGEL